LDLGYAGVGAVDETGSGAGIQGDVCGDDIPDAREIESVDRLLQVSFFVVDVDAAAAAGGTGNCLGDEEELMDGVELDIAGALGLIVGSGENFGDAGLLLKIVELHAEIDFGGGAGDLWGVREGQGGVHGG
jgi:hypothetical protein